MPYPDLYPHIPHTRIPADGNMFVDKRDDSFMVLKRNSNKNMIPVSVMDRAPSSSTGCNPTYQSFLKEISKSYKNEKPLGEDIDLSPVTAGMMI
jgi:hypothetical protein